MRNYRVVFASFHPFIFYCFIFLRGLWLFRLLFQCFNILVIQFSR